MEKQFLLAFISFGLVHPVYICYFFRFDASPKKLFVSFHYYVLFVCRAPVVFLNNFRYPDYVRPTLRFSIENHIFSWLLLPEMTVKYAII